MADNDDDSDIPSLPPANPTGPYKFSEEGNNPDSVQAVNNGDDGEELPEANEPPPYKNGF